MLGGQSNLQIVANAMAPYAAEQIGKQLGGKDKPTAEQLVAHAILGATLAYINGGNVTAGAASAVAAEASASYLSQIFTDEAVVRDISSAIATVIGGGIGGSLHDAQISGTIGKNAAENNWLSKAEVQSMLKKLVNAETTEEKEAIYQEYAKLSKTNSLNTAQKCLERNSLECLQDIQSMKEGLAFAENEQQFNEFISTISKPVYIEPEENLTAIAAGDVAVLPDVVVTAEKINHGERTDVGFVEYENLIDIAKYSDAETREKIEAYLRSRDYKYTNQPKSDKPGWTDRYLFPGLGMIGASGQIVGGAIGGAGTCAESFGAGCVAGGYIIMSGADDFMTAWHNYGKDPQYHRNSLREQILIDAGLSGNAASWTAIGLDLAAGGVVGAVSSDINGAGKLGSISRTDKVNNIIIGAEKEGTTAVTTNTVSKSEIGMEWGQGIQKQGMPWEDYVAKSLPADWRLPKNFKTFDFYDEKTGKAISAKTLDTTTPAKVKNPQQIYNTLKGHIDAAANFTKYKLGEISITAGDISSKEIHLAIPAATNKVQWQQIQSAIDYGKSQGVIVIVTGVK